ncbi:MAG: bifunctional hydroxymethylpyrimidine kinase/phosphomethylpyrimidine kinase [Acidobacteriota bacterium]
MQRNELSRPGAVRRPRALTIAGSDSGGGAGIQADLKTFGALGVHGMSAITSVTAQNTVEVGEIYDLPARIVRRQIDLVASDIGVDAAKTGMLSSVEIIETVAEAVSRQGIGTLVVDPVMVSTSGAPLIAEAAVGALVERLFPLALLVTPNLHEAEALTGLNLDCDEAIEAAAAAILRMGPRAVLIKGGHREQREEVADLLADAAGREWLRAPRVPTRNNHGSGCTLSAAIVAGLASGLPLLPACQQAKQYVTEALKHSLELGHGPGPLGHFYALWQ